MDAKKVSDLSGSKIRAVSHQLHMNRFACMTISYLPSLPHTWQTLYIATACDYTSFFVGLGREQGQASHASCMYCLQLEMKATAVLFPEVYSAFLKEALKVQTSLRQMPRR